MQTKEELIRQLRLLKEEAGSHSPSIFTIKEAIPELKVKVDACFLSNPYATDLFLEYFKRELLDTGGLRDLLEFYPSQNRVIAESLSSAIGIHPDNIFIGNGAIEIIQTVIQRYTKSKIVINIPTFSSYYEFINDDVEVVYNKLLKENNYELDIDAYIKLVKKERPDTVVLINPNNPNGGYMDSEKVHHLLRELRDVKNFILDESFIHFAYENEYYDLKTASNLVYKFPNLILVKSMSKDFGIAGIRAGYAVMNSRRVQELLLNGFLWNSNGLSEYFFRLYTRDEFLKEYEQVRVKYIKETQEFIKQLKQIPKIKVYPSMANFALIEILNGESSDDFVFNMLINHGIYLRTCSDKIGLNGEFVRLASRTKDENQYIIECFKKI
ncbi:aminotransferase [Aquaticitalea lipolytica]|uniref:Aminotransferase n=1 Tax=Aquaticitalea lipolytica TaxID=1247562 RepID=A0A8J2TS36_9FLAO|nr:histidinol-phosphate transaminase [Aquaticitalea lipolytica]GFZ83671.1 aminotransferase [Aquaticitalea lipolytica]